jgi:hypothetical protein
LKEHYHSPIAAVVEGRVEIHKIERLVQLDKNKFASTSGKGLLHIHHNSIKSILETNFQEHKWNYSKFIQKKTTSKSQQELADQLKSLFPGMM